ncbi:hypothetical protein [Psychromonas sp. L1A2]|uniref:hypothetical protein n=1 Tax=Psychromonas sp. L1A2 TaxID=2686356 RepID=UPI00135CF36A|nr:hypothetical protein [Psychromonas sp. L1A2]
MKLKKQCFKFIEASLVILLPSTAIANDLPGSISESYISFGLEHIQSNNINQSSDNEQSGFEQRADIGIGYFNQTATNFTALDYSVYYSTSNGDELDDDSDVSGSLSITQEIFSPNLLLNLNHFRRQYLLDQSGVDNPANSGSRDVFTINPVWNIPYSRRAGFELSYDYTATRYSDDEDEETDRNGVGVTWYNKLTPKARFELSTNLSQVNFRNTGFDYKEVTVDASIDGELLAGTYLVLLGYSRVILDAGDEEGGIFKLSYGYQFDRHNLSVNLQRELSDSSLGLGTDNLDNEDDSFDDNEVLWIDRVDLQHRFIITNRLSNSNTLYYQQETSVTTDETDPRWGASVSLDFQNTKKISSFISLDYSESTISTDFDKQVINATIGGRYLIRPQLSLSLQANYEDQSIDDDEDSSYDELSYTARIEFKY